MSRHRTTSSIALALLLACAACASNGLSSKEKTQQIENHTEQAQQYLTMGELDRAEGQTLKGLELDPKNTRLKVIRAKVLIKRGRPEDVLRAEKLLREIASEDDYQVHLCLGIALERKGVAYDEAAAALESGKRVTEAADPVARIAELKRDAISSWRDSVASYTRCIGEHAEDTDAMNGLMRVHGLLGEKEKSLGWAEKLLSTTLTDLEFWKKQMLRAEMSADEETRMRNLVKQYSELQSKTHLTASILLHDLGRDSDAEAHVTLAIEIDPQQAELYGRRAELRMAQKKYDLAKQDLDTFLRHSTRPFDHPDVRRASNLLRECEEALRTVKS
jgi:tetratricopeptide (TPR) repeat protein